MDAQQKCHRPDLQEKEQYQEFLDRYSLTITCKMLHLHVLSVTNSNSIPPCLRKGRPTRNLLGMYVSCENWSDMNAVISFAI